MYVYIWYINIKRQQFTYGIFMNQVIDICLDCFTKFQHTKLKLLYPLEFLSLKLFISEEMGEVCPMGKCSKKDFDVRRRFQKQMQMHNRNQS